MDLLFLDAPLPNDGVESAELDAVFHGSGRPSPGIQACSGVATGSTWCTPVASNTRRTWPESPSVTRKRWPDWIENKAIPRLDEPLSLGDIAITYVNHATFIIQIAGITIVTDPVWSERASPVPWAGPKRVRDPGAVEPFQHAQ